MKNPLRNSLSLRTSLTLALLVLVCVATVAAADTTATDTEAADAVGTAAATGPFSKLPESGALLLWGTGLALASCVVARKRSDNK